VVQLTYFKFYYKVSTSKATEGQRKDGNQLQMRRVATNKQRPELRAYCRRPNALREKLILAFPNEKRSSAQRVEPSTSTFVVTNY